MSKISLIAAVDPNNGLGKNNKLLCHLPADLAHFKQITINKPILMGHNTYLSIGRPLPGRRNIVLSKKPRILTGVEVAQSVKEALDLVQDSAEVMVIGGAEIFKETLSMATTIYLTLIHHTFEADVFFPVLEAAKWQREKIGFYKHDEKNPYDMTFYKIMKKSI